MLDLQHRALAGLVRRVQRLGDHAVEAGALELAQPRLGEGRRRPASGRAAAAHRRATARAPTGVPPANARRGSCRSRRADRRRRTTPESTASLATRDAAGCTRCERVEVEALGPTTTISPSTTSRRAALVAPRRARGSSGRAGAGRGSRSTSPRRAERRSRESRPTSARRRGRPRVGARARAWPAWRHRRADGERHRGSAIVRRRPGQQVVHGAAVHDARGVELGVHRQLGAGGRASRAARAWASVSMLERHPSRPPGAAGPGAGPGARARIDLHRRPGAGAGGEHRLGVERRLGSAPPRDEAAGAVAQDVGVGALDGGEQYVRSSGPSPCAAWSGRWPPRRRAPPGGRGPGRADPVLEDVHLDPGQDPERRQPFVEIGEHVELLAEPLGVQPVGHREACAVVGQDEVLVAEGAGRLGRRGSGCPRRTSPSASGQLPRSDPSSS